MWAGNVSIFQSIFAILPEMDFKNRMEDNMNIPNHVAIILDGNGRWAKKRMMPRQYGHANSELIPQRAACAPRLSRISL